MRSTNSFFNPTLYQKQLIRFWPLWGAYGFIMILIMPLYLLTNATDVADFSTFYVLEMATQVAPWIAAFAGILGAMAVWSYLYNNRSVGMLHALPMKRDGLFFTNYLAGLSFLFLPTLVVFCLTLGAEALMGAVDVRNLVIWLVIQCLLYLFFFSFATLIAFVTGALVALPALYIIFNGLAAGLVLLLNNTFATFVYGFTSALPLNNVGFWLSPMLVFVRRLDFETSYFDETLDQVINLDPAQISGLPVVAGAAVIGLVMAGLALILYRRRKLELAGEVIAVPWLRPVFKYGVALCGSLAFGNAFYAIFSDSLSEGIVTMLVFLLLWGAVFYFVAEMLLKKSFRVFQKSWRGCVTLLCVIVACAAVMELDVTGYEKSIPSADDVESLSFETSYLYGDTWHLDQSAQDPDRIAQVIDLHTALVNGKREVETRLRQDYHERSWVEDDDGLSYDVRDSQYLNLIYTMKDGSVRKRHYEIPVNELLLEDAASPAAKLDALLNDPAWTMEFLLPEKYQRDLLVAADLDVMYLDRNEDQQSGLRSDSVALQVDQPGLLYDAVKEDLDAGRLGRIWLLQNKEYLQTQYCNTLQLHFYGPYGTDKNGQPVNTTRSVNISLLTTATSTLALLKSWGYEDGEDLWTFADANRYEKINNNYYQDAEIAAEYSY